MVPLSVWKLLRSSLKTTETRQHRQQDAMVLTNTRVDQRRELADPKAYPRFENSSSGNGSGRTPLQQGAPTHTWATRCVF